MTNGAAGVAECNGGNDAKRWNLLLNIDGFTQMGQRLPSKKTRRKNAINKPKQVIIAACSFRKYL